MLKLKISVGSRFTLFLQQYSWVTSLQIVYNLVNLWLSSFETVKFQFYFSVLAVLKPVKLLEDINGASKWV